MATAAVKPRLGLRHPPPPPPPGDLGLRNLGPSCRRACRCTTAPGSTPIIHTCSVALSEDEHRVLQRFAQVEAKPSVLTRDAVHELCQLVGELPDGPLAHHFEERLKSLEALLERLERDKRGPRKGDGPSRRLPSTAEALRRSGDRSDPTDPKRGGRSHPSF